MTRDELIAIGKRIVACDGTEAEMDALYDLFGRNVPHPNGANLFFYPENFNDRVDDLSAYKPTVEEVVDKCLAYRSIQL
ncbi:MAG: colicin immunity protein [Proteobacteria bacterium]|nr:MAG: colicin immunity protein [Pseudomonadota bacterium]